MSPRRRGPETPVCADPSGYRQYVGDTDLSAITRLNGSTRLRATIATERIETIKRVVPPGWPIGLEQSLLPIAWPDLPHEDECRDYLDDMGILYSPDGMRPEVLDRPVSELGIISLFRAMDMGPLRRADLARALRLMGVEPKWRVSPARTKPFPSGHYTEFADPKSRARHFERMLTSITRRGPGAAALIRAVKVYFTTVVYHPLQDGNGRAARALFQCVLKTDLAIDSPIFPLGPFLERHKRTLLNAKWAWHRDADANPLVQFIAEAMIAYCDHYASQWSRGSDAAAGNSTSVPTQA